MSNISSVTNYFPTANEGFTAITTTALTANPAIVPLSTVSGLVSGSIFVGIIEPNDATKKQVFTGTVDVTNSRITGCVWTRGTSLAGHTSGVTVVDYTTGTAFNMLSAGVLKEHKQSGAHGNITADNLSVGGVNVMSLLPAGVVMPYGGASAPTYWLLCNGAAVSRTTYAALYTAIGTTYGVGDGTTTFNLPDMRGRTPVGADPTALRNTVNKELGQSGGSQTHILTTAEMPTHGFSFGHHGDEGGSLVRSPNVTGGTFSANATLADTYRPPTAAVGGAASYQQPGWSFGSSAAHNNMQPYTNFNYIIKA